MVKNKIIMTIFLSLLIVYGCNKTPGEMDKKVDSLFLPDKNYDISVFIDPTGGVFASDIIDIYYVYRNSKYKIIKKFYYEPPYLNKIIRIDKFHAVYIRIKRDSVPMDTTYIELK